MPAFAVKPLKFLYTAEQLWNDSDNEEITSAEFLDLKDKFFVLRNLHSRGMCNRAFVAKGRKAKED
jgi:hypothetical protein